ncbi:MAG: hypothetical protein ABSB22_24165 [Thermodesulfobacteriota bacterium]|jgi:hypothetical protein
MSPRSKRKYIEAIYLFFVPKKVMEKKLKTILNSRYLLQSYINHVFWQHFPMGQQVQRIRGEVRLSIGSRLIQPAQKERSFGIDSGKAR